MNSLLLIPLLPFAIFLLLGFFGKKIPGNASGWIAAAAMFASFLLSVITAADYFFVSGKTDGVYQSIVAWEIPWLKFSESLSINMGILLDPISVMMLLVVTFVSLMVHVYSIKYMKGEERYAIFFSYLSLFTFSMLGLVMASNLFQIYIFWELVGVSSFLLIGFYYDKPSAVKASKKAFIVTRFADLGFLIGILILAFGADTLDFHTLISRLTDSSSSQLNGMITTGFLGASALTWGLSLVFIGGAGKSAMFPLHIWLPDAMEGPTPVSALIHAATMVVAGVYLVARLFPVMALSCPAVLDLVTTVGLFSAAMAAIIACTQTDIKRILAYSTMSQIGYMMFSLGVSRWGGDLSLGYTASMFHLFTHAFFKALLFLGAGVVIHHVHSNELKDMGGLRKHLPVTHITFLIACLAIAGIPPLSGFFSKEEILLASWNHSKPVYVIALLTSALTAFYMFRLYFGIFFSSPTAPLHKENGDGHHANGEGGFIMLLPLILLCAGAALAGFIPFGNFVSADGAALHTEVHFDFALAPVLLSIAGILLAMKMYKTHSELPQKISNSFDTAYRWAYHKFYVDELYLFITKKVLFKVVGRPAAWIDRQVVDGSVNLTADAAETISEGMRPWQSGRVQQYAWWFVAGVAVMVVVVMCWK